MPGAARVRLSRGRRQGAGSPFAIGEANSTPHAGAFSNQGDLYAYVNFQRGTVNVFRVDRATGALTRMAAPVPSGQASAGVAWSPDGKLLAVSGAEQSSTQIRVAMFRVNRQTGTVVAVSGSPFRFPSGAPGLTANESLVFHPSGNFLASGDSMGGTVHLFGVNQSTGGVTEVAGSPKASHPNGLGSGNETYHLAFSPDGTLLASANAGSNGCCGTTVSMFKVNAAAGTWARTTQGAMTIATKPKSVSFNPAGNKLLIAYSQTANPINLGKLALVNVNKTTGAMSNLALADPGPAQPFASAKFSPFGSLIAVAASYPLGGPNKLAIWQFNAGTGALHAFDSSPFAIPDIGPAGADALSWSPAGGLVAVVTGFGDSIAVFKTPPSATVTLPASGATYPQGTIANASYTCADGVAGPGIKTCAGDVANGSAIDTATPGEHTFTVTATSKDGLVTAKTVTYTVTAPDMSMSLQGRPNPLSVGSQLTYKLRMRNDGFGDGDRRGRVLTLAPSETFVSATSACAHAAGVVTCTIPRALLPGAGATPSVTVTEGLAGMVDATATVSSAGTDPTPDNNASTERTTVWP